MVLVELPTYIQMMNPVIQVLKQLGGSGTIDEINALVFKLIQLSDEQLQVAHKNGGTEIEYRLAWTRTYLKTAGFLENSSRGVWSLTSEGRSADRLDEQAIVRKVRASHLRKKPELALETTREIDEEIDWRSELLDTLLNISPAAFERLIQRMLRESGFTEVEVTGRSGDGGIDGRGIMQIGGLLSFRVIFQCKRWRGTVGSSQVRDFRGAMVGRADKGLLFTTGTFTPDAIKEAIRDGAPPIDLIKGDQLLTRLKELSLGVHTERRTVEDVIVNRAWFKSLED